MPGTGRNGLRAEFHSDAAADRMTATDADVVLDVATAPMPNSRHWQQSEVTWGDVLAWVDHPADQKECGNYLLGDLQETTAQHGAKPCTKLHRNKQAVVSRGVLTLDADNARPELPDHLELLHGWTSLTHTTYSSTPDKLRMRVLVLLSRTVTSDEYRRIAAWTMQQLGTDQFDPGSTEPERFMFKPSCQAPERFESWAVDGEPLDVDAVLAAAPPNHDAPAGVGADGGGLPYDELNDAQQYAATQEVQRVLRYWRDHLADAAGWGEGRRDGDERGWEALTYQFAWALANLAAAAWAPMSEDGAAGLYDDLLPPEIADDPKCAGKWTPTIVAKAAVEGSAPPPWARDFQPEPGGDDAASEKYAAIPKKLDDAHLAEWMAREGLASDWRWAGGLGWMHWGGRRWSPRREEDAREAVRLAAIQVNGRALDSGADAAQMKALYGLLSTGRIGALTSLMKGIVSIDPGSFDQEPDLLNAGNGVVDLRTGKLLPHDRDLLLTKLTETAYKPEAVHADWDKALDALDPDVSRWMQVRFGQAATGYPTSDDVLPVGQGSGSNGKSTWLNALYAALGEHMALIPEKLLRANPNDHPTELMTLFGVRVAVIDETPEVAQLNVQRLKATVGQERITARQVHRDNVQWKATHSLFVMTNYVPSVRETDHGTWRRLALVRFSKTFDRDDRYRARMSGGRAGRREAVLAWVVEGAMRWYANDRVMPPAPDRVVSDTRAWRQESDSVLAYLTDRIVFDPDSCVLSAELLDDLNDWLHEGGQHPWSDKLLSSRMGEHEEVVSHRVTKANPRHPRGLVRRHPHDPEPSTARPKVWQGMRFRLPKDD